MESELNIILNNIKKTTGIDIDVYAETQKFFYTTRGEDEKVYTLNKEFTDVFADTVTNRTYFRMNYKNTKLIGSISGATKVEYNYATLIKKLVESETEQDKNFNKSDFIKALLNGDLNRTQVQKYMGKFSMPSTPCFVLSIVHSIDEKEQLLAVLENFSVSKDIVLVMNDNTFAYIRFCSVNDDFSSSTDFAKVLSESIFEETGIKVNIGIGNTVKKFSDSTQSYAQSQVAIKMAETITGESRIHSFREFVLYKMLEEIPKYKLGEYFDTLLDESSRNILSDEDMIKTGREFLKNDLNISETANSMYLHRNTLIYRLDKIETATGLDIRKFSDAVTFNLAVILNTIIK